MKRESQGQAQGSHISG